MSAPQEPAFGMTALDEALASPEGPAFARALVARLETQLFVFRAALSAGLGPEDYRRAGAIVAALEAARQLFVPAGHHPPAT